MDKKIKLFSLFDGAKYSYIRHELIYTDLPKIISFQKITSLLEELSHKNMHASVTDAGEIEISMSATDC